MSASLALTPTDAAPYDRFGWSVSLSADGLTAIVGGPEDDVGANENQGSARVFAWNGTSWVQRGEALTPSDGAETDYFGRSVSLSADGLTAIVGGPGDAVGANLYQGSARVFAWNGTSWVQRGGALTPTDGAGWDNFGMSVSLSADGLTAVVGGDRDDIGANADQGSARVFTWNGTSWVQRGGALTPTDGATYDYFGESVSLSADGLTAIVGGPGDNVGANFNEGSARVFAWNGTSWVQRGGALTPTDGSTDGEYNDLFGSSVSLSADGLTAIVGGPGDDVGENAIQGSARVFTWNGTSWVQRGGALTPTDGAETDYFGRSVSLSADGLTAIVGGPGDDVGANEDQGSARVFAWNGTSWVQRGEALTPSDGARYEYFGHSVSLSADGLTAIVGGPSDSVYRIAQGSARVFAWNGTSWVEGGPATVVRGPTEGADTLTGTLSPDTLMGLGGNDNITGLAGDDKLLGGDANDTLDGGAGADTLDGGAGNDLFLISDAGDVVLELADGGADTVITAINFTLPNHVEAMLIAEGASGITITGGAGNDVLIGNGLANTFDGGAGDDVILAGNVTLADIYALFAM